MICTWISRSDKWEHMWDVSVHSSHRGSVGRQMFVPRGPSSSILIPSQLYAVTMQSSAAFKPQELSQDTFRAFCMSTTETRSQRTWGDILPPTSGLEVGLSRVSHISGAGVVVVQPKAKLRTPRSQHNPVGRYHIADFCFFS